MTLPQKEELKCLGVLSTSDDKMDYKMNRRNGVLSAVMRVLLQSIMAQKERRHGKALHLLFTVFSGL